MDKMKSILIPVSWILGVLAFWAILYFYNKGRSNDISGDIVQQDINNCENISLRLDSVFVGDYVDIKENAHSLGSSYYPY